MKNTIVEWHIGLIQETSIKIDSLNFLDKKFIVVFDFDLYSASKIAWDAISKHLKEGDIIYFDEAFEADEARLIDEITEKDLKLEILGYTIMGIAYKVL